MENDDSVIIRPATSEDAEGILRAHRDAIFSKAAADYSAEQMEAWATQLTPERIAEKKRRLAEGELVTFVSDVDGVIVGFGELVPAKNCVGAVYVAPGTWRGVGTRLLQAVENEARRLGISEICCDSSLNAENFYSKCGYEVVERAMHHLQRSGVEIPCVKMKKRL